MTFVSLVVGFAAPLAAIALAFGAYLNVFVSIDPRVSGALLVVVLSALNGWRVSAGAGFQNAFTIGKVLLIAAFVVLGWPQMARITRGAVIEVRNADFVTAARNAVAAGLDGVEVHAANGYLLHQFLDPTVNLRDDVYGGSPENRARFVIEVVTAVADAIGAERVGLRLSPAHRFNGIGEEIGADLTATYRAVVDAVATLGLAYLSLLASPLEPLESLVRDLRERFDGVVLLNDGFGDLTTLESVEQLLDTGLADAVVVGRQFLANPDLAERWKAGAELNAPNPDTFYGGGAEGYTDYPALAEATCGTRCSSIAFGAIPRIGSDD